MVSNPYSVLGITKDASKEEIKKAYRKRQKSIILICIQMTRKQREKMNEINEAYDMLCNPENIRDKLEMVTEIHLMEMHRETHIIRIPITKIPTIRTHMEIQISRAVMVRFGI